MPDAGRERKQDGSPLHVRSGETPIDTGFSTCPNDTFMFHGLVHGHVASDSIAVVPHMADIEALNHRALAGPGLAVSKLSASALFTVGHRYQVIDAGAALGRGCGPMVVSQRGSRSVDSLAALRGKKIAIPGRHTTAYLLFRIFGPAEFVPVEMRFDMILPAIARGEVDAGLIIHESRFTYQNHGLGLVVDLGDLWESDSGLPIPLGLICARRDLGAETIARFEDGLRRSVQLAFTKPELSLPWIREHAQDLDDEVCRRHIDLYVNDFSVTLGLEGRAAIETLMRRAKDREIIPRGAANPW